MSERIDAHHHLWCYRPEHYSWIGAGMEAIARDFLPENLLEELTANGIAGSVAVQASQTVAETEWLLGLADQNSFIRGVVGWAPIASPRFAEHLEKLSARKKLKGLRHVLQDEQDDELIRSEAFNKGIAALAQTSLVYDLLIYERQLPETIAFVDRHPKQVFVLDHIAKPRIAKREVEPWRKNIAELARRENVYCKLSGMVTEANWTGWTGGQLKRYSDVVLEVFGPARLMFGSDWPVCLLAAGYGRWLETARTMTGELSEDEKVLVFGTVAKGIYNLSSNT
jgi:L-fuconolactonase